MSELEKLMVHYGPPYKEEYGGCLYEECNNPKPSIIEIHGLLGHFFGLYLAGEGQNVLEIAGFVRFSQRR